MVLFLFVAGLVFQSCGRNSPQLAFERASLAFLHGELRPSQEESERWARTSSPEWAWKFRILEAKAALARGLFDEVLKIFETPRVPSGRPDLSIPALTLTGAANAHLHNFAQAAEALNRASRWCDASDSLSCGDLLQARGLLASEQNQSEIAQGFYEASLAFARSHGDRYLESTSLLNLGDESLDQGYLDKALDQSEAAYRAARIIHASIPELVAQGNIGWVHYRLGNTEMALGLSIDSEKAAARLEDVYDQENELTNLGYIYMDSRKFDLASRSFQQALQLAQGIKAQQDIYNALRVLARLSLQTDDLLNADRYAQQALAIPKQSMNRQDELYPLLVEGQVEARRGDSAAAEKTFHEVEQDKTCPVFLKWEAEHSLAQLYQAEKRPDSAGREYRSALATFEAARDTVRHEDSQLSFLTNAARIYDDYVRFLVDEGKSDEALRWADYNRARTLAEGFGRLAKTNSTGPPPLHPRQIAQFVKGTVLFYWLGEKQSYLWRVTPRQTKLFTLPPGAEIEDVLQRYRRSLAGPENVLESADRDGLALYRMLVAPAQPSIEKDAKVFIIPDGGLNNLNFETLLVPGPKLHYWIEDATISSANSLRLLGTSGKSKPNRDRSLFLVGNSVAADDKYPELPKAAAQMQSVARHFPAAQQTILTRQQATPTAYLAGNPDRFSYIHFVAHGTASRLSPLDSAIVLSKGAAQGDSFKLYARDIIRHPLRAELVTISACYSAGERAYAGEGLVGLSWAFLKAGAHNVIAALWDATDASTELLMDKFYDELNRGSTPDVALRAAKLSLLRDSSFRNPFYWAPFQLYVRSN